MKIKIFFLSGLVSLCGYSLESAAKASIKEEVKKHCALYGKAEAEDFFEQQVQMTKVYLSEEGIWSLAIDNISHWTTNIDAAYDCSFVFVIPEANAEQTHEIMIYIWLTQNQEFAESLYNTSKIYQLASIPSPSGPMYMVMRNRIVHMFGPYW